MTNIYCKHLSNNDGYHSVGKAHCFYITSKDEAILLRGYWCQHKPQGFQLVPKQGQPQYTWNASKECKLHWTLDADDCNAHQNGTRLSWYRMDSSSYPVILPCEHNKKVSVLAWNHFERLTNIQVFSWSQSPEFWKLLHLLCSEVCILVSKILSIRLVTGKSSALRRQRIWGWSILLLLNDPSKSGHNLIKEIFWVGLIQIARELIISLRTTALIR